MSDCSRQAMMPKGRRTCGTCSRSFTARKVMPQCMCELDELDDSGCMPTHDDNEGACCRWIAKSAIIEQRYERLAQVAREMYELIERWETERDDDRERLDGPSPCRGMVATAAKRQLEELGVSVDD